MENITNTASELKYLNELKSLLHREIADPSEGFITFFTKQIYPKVITAKVKEQFAPIIKRSFNQLISDAISERLKSALNQEKEKDVAEAVKIEEIIATEPGSGIVTTEEEIEGFFIVKSILRETTDPKRITYRDALSYFAILLDDNNRKTICRLYLNAKKYLVVLDENKKEIKHELQSLDDLYHHVAILNDAVARLESAKAR